MREDQVPPTKKNSFTSRVWTCVAITAFVTVLLLLFWKAIQVFLLILAGSIVAIYFHGFADMIGRTLKLSRKWSLAASIVISLLFLTGICLLIGTRIVAEAQQFSEKLPGLVDDASAYIQQNKSLKTIYNEVASSKLLEKASPMLSGFFRSSFGALGDLYVVIFIGIFFTAAPTLYKKGAVRLLPATARQEGEHIMDSMAVNLKGWLKGMLFSMLVVFILTSIGLVALGIDLWLILALIAGLLSFIPNFGPIIAIVPAALVALAQSPVTALWVIVLYCMIQLLESNFITPLVQQELIKTPPALIIITQVFMGIWLGGWGIILATPILVIIMVLVDRLYVQKQDAAADLL